MSFIARLCQPRGHEADEEQASVQTCNIPLLNPTLKPAPNDSAFPLFSFLPKELRLQIWEEATPRKRLVHILVTWRRNQKQKYDAPMRFLEKNHLGNPICRSGYTLSSSDGELDHPLLLVNREARKVVLDFYRIQMPAYCSKFHYRKTAHDMTLRINPEHDVLQILAEDPVKQSLIDFLWDLKAYDPKGVGLLKVAMGLPDFCINDLQYLKPSDLLLIRQRQAFVETLSQLREVWFINVEPGRSMYQPSADTGDSVVPYGIAMSGYENLGPDTRQGVEAELGQVHMGSVDPRELVWRWKRLLHTWKIRHPEGQVRYRCMLAQQQTLMKDQRPARGFGRIREILSGNARARDRYLAEYGKSFSPGTCEAGGKSFPDQVNPEVPNPELPNTERTAAVGFWSFPIEALGDIGEGRPLRDLDYEPNRVLDLRSYWPELLLAKSRF